MQCSFQKEERVAWKKKRVLGKKIEAALDPIMLGIFTEHLSCPKHDREICKITNMNITWVWEGLILKVNALDKVFK